MYVDGAACPPTCGQLDSSAKAVGASKRGVKEVVTDSGGITEESTVLGVPRLTRRDNTERPETVTVGTNQLVGTDPSAIRPALRRLVAGQWKRGGIPELWDGRAATRIVATFETLVVAPER